MPWTRVESNPSNAQKQVRGVRLRRSEHHDHHHQSSSHHREEFVAASSALSNGRSAMQGLNGEAARTAPFWRAALSDERIGWLAAAIAAVDGTHRPRPACFPHPNFVSGVFYHKFDSLIRHFYVCV